MAALRLPVSQCVDQQRERGRRMAPVRVIEMVALERLAPCAQHFDQLPGCERRAHVLLGQIREPDAGERSVPHEGDAAVHQLAAILMRCSLPAFMKSRGRNSPRVGTRRLMHACETRSGGRLGAEGRSRYEGLRNVGADPHGDGPHVLRQSKPPPARAQTLGLRHFNFAQMRHYNFALTRKLSIIVFMKIMVWSANLSTRRAGGNSN